MGMTLKELLTKGEGTLSAQEAKDLAAQCRMDVETLYTLLEERGIKILDNEVEADTSLDVDSIIAEVENAENNSDDMGISEEEEESAEENPADLKAAMDELLDDPVKNYLKQIGQIPLLSAEQEVELSRRIHAGAAGAGEQVGVGEPVGLHLFLQRLGNMGLAYHIVKDLRPPFPVQCLIQGAALPFCRNKKRGQSGTVRPHRADGHFG